MRSRHNGNVDAKPSPLSRSIVPESLSSPLGILDVSTLQLLLSSSEQAGRNQTDIGTRHAQGDGHRPASSELARAYNVPTEEACILSSRSRRRGLIQSKQSRQRRPVPSKLQPMAMESAPAAHGPPTRPAQHGADRNRALANTDATQSSAPSIHGTSRHRVANAAAHLHRASGRDYTNGALLSVDTATCTSSELVSVSRPRQVVRAVLRLNPSHDDDGDCELRRELQWIHQHFPVRRLANAKCSLTLRGKILVDTLAVNLKRGSLRLALVQWTLVVAQQKQVEAAKLKAFGRMVAMFDHALRDQLEHRFSVWSQCIESCRTTERLAAAVTIQQWLVSCRNRRAGRDSLVALSLARALAMANDHATRIQRCYRVHAAQQILRNALRAVMTIQRFVRATNRRRILAERHEAARRVEELSAQMRQSQLLESITMRSRDRQARKIADAWRGYAAWRAQLVCEYVTALVDEVEFFAAVLSTQRRLRGYQCRLRMKRKTTAIRRIQIAWRRYDARRRAREQRKMLLLARHMAASCLQRTFQRNRERKAYRAALQSSSRPMFLRALGASGSFRVRFHVPIVKSAVSVIQSTWRRYAAYKQWTYTRDMAARQIQRWRRHGQYLFAWHDAAHSVLALHRDQLCHDAVRRLQRWLRTCVGWHVETKRALATRQLREMLASVRTIQRYYRRKHDMWRRVLQHVVLDELPRYRKATRTIQNGWRQYADKTRHLLAMYGTDCGDAAIDRPRSLGLHGLQAFLTRQQRERERRDCAVQTIQKAYRQWLARREGKLLLKKYRVLFQRELRRRQQRGVIHGYLIERQDARSIKQQARVAHATGLPSSSVSPLTVGTPTPTSTNDAPMIASNSTNTNTSNLRSSETLDDDTTVVTGSSDDPDVVQCWSDEHQCHYWFNARTGESTWCS